MTRKENNMTTATKNEIDWQAAEVVAERLGVHSRELVAEQDADAVGEWALQMASQHATGRFMEPRVASYFELAALVGHHEPIPAQPRLDWLERTLKGIERELGNVRDVLAAVAAESTAGDESDEEVEITHDDLPADFLDEQEEDHPDE
jgi:hypothetical protein